MNVLKWFFQICTSQDGEVESRKAHILENGGSNPSPAINLLKVTLSVYRWSMTWVDYNIMMLIRLCLILLTGVQSEKALQCGFAKW